MFADVVAALVDQGVWIAPIIVALVTALGAYLAVVRKASGRIATTEAGELWQEAKNLRDAYLADIERLTLRLERVEARVKSLETEREQLLEKIEKLEEENRALRALEEENRGLRAQNLALQRELEDLKKRLSKVEDDTYKLQEGANDAPADATA